MDLVAFESEDIPVQGCTEIRVHNGMLLTAQNIRRKLLGLDELDRRLEEGLLEKAWRQLEKDVGRETAQVNVHSNSGFLRKHLALKLNRNCYLM